MTSKSQKHPDDEAEENLDEPEPEAPAAPEAPPPAPPEPEGQKPDAKGPWGRDG